MEVSEEWRSAIGLPGNLSRWGGCGEGSKLPRYDEDLDWELCISWMRAANKPQPIGEGFMESTPSFYM